MTELVMSSRAMFENAAFALGKIDRDGIRGITRLSVQDIEAMALALVAFGLVAVCPGTSVPDQLTQKPGGTDYVAPDH